ncbi:transposase domain-containing protein [Mycolicibacterium mengxianglii]|uniref:transposase domain-containing protein n=1 Tax=Mycolicibacterium mengxianglii TaxID=2736649 RepID=UPI0018D13BCF|nr:transposase domain-containing protein [Mycolicibacterium mengxianglii]
MAGTAAVDRLALAALVHALPMSAVEAALCASGRVAQRVRTLPPWVTTYHVLASAMYPSAGYDEVTALLWSTLPAAAGRGLAQQPPSRGAVTRARLRLGVEPFESLLEQQLREVTAGNPVDRVYLQRVTHSGGGLWWICDTDTGAVRGCDLRGDDDAAAARLVARVRAKAVVVCPPYDEWSRRVLERLGAALPVEVGELPARFAGPWSSLRARSGAASAQDAMARACVRVALETALKRAGNTSFTPPDVSL